MSRLSAAIVTTVALVAGSAVNADSESQRCTTDHPHWDSGATVVVAMSLINDGESCVMRRTLGDLPATSVMIRGKPASGTLSSNRSSVAYTPNPGFVGKDAFDVQWFFVGFGPNSGNRNVRTKVDVTVRAASDHSDAAREEPEAKSAKPAM